MTRREAARYVLPMDIESDLARSLTPDGDHRTRLDATLRRIDASLQLLKRTCPWPDLTGPCPPPGPGSARD